MPKKERSMPYSVEVQKGLISMDEQYSAQLKRQPECMLRDIENNRMRQEKMTLTLHVPKQ